MNQIKRNAVITAIISTTISTALAHGDGSHGDQIEELEATTAIARRASQITESASSIIYSIEPDALRPIGIFNLTESVEQLPGVIISSSGQQGVRAPIRLRGLRSSDTQIRIDGIRFSDRLANQSTFLGNASLNGLSEIELIQGSQAALYGGGSLAGVLNLTTKTGSKDIKKRITIEGGSFNSLSVDTEYGGSINKFNYYLSTKHSTTDNDTHGDNSETANSDNDSVSHSSTVRLGYNLTEDLKFGLTFRRNSSETETPNSFGGNRVNSDFTLGSLFADYQVTDKLKSKLTLSYLTEDTIFGSSFGNSGANYDQFGITLENTFQYSGTSALNFGVEYENQDFTGFGTPSGRKDHYSAIYANHAYELSNLTIDTGIRYENYQSFGSHTSWKAGVKYDLADDKTSLRANLATGFKTPQLLELFSPFLFGLAGNPNLTPETSLGWDIGIQHRINDNHEAHITLFETEIEDAIIGNFTTGLFENTPGNSKASGIELAFDGDITDQINYKINYTWLNKSFNGQPEQQANAQIIFKPNEKTQFGFGAKYLDKRSYGGDPLDDTLIIRTFGSYQLNEKIKLHGRIENLTDTNYSHFRGFGSDSPARRLGAFAGVTIEW